jgi:REP element-mobilizing transposase RayT
MPRHKRLEIPDGIYHVIQRGIERREIFKDDADREEFLRRLEGGIIQTGHKCYGWVLMPNHFHLLIQTGAKALSELMRKVLSGYAIYFNARHKRRGYLYQNRYKSILCQKEEYLLELVRYIHLNPLRAKIVKDTNSLNKYKWSGHSVLMGTNKAEFQSTNEILERFGETRGIAVKRYLEFIEDAKDMSRREDLSGGGLRRSAGGWEGVCALRRANEFWRGDERILGDGEFVNAVLKISEEELTKKERLKKDGWDINKVVSHVCKLMNLKEEEIKKRSRESKISQARGLTAYFLNKELGINCVEIGRYFKITKQSASEAVARGGEVAKVRGYVL